MRYIFDDDDKLFWFNFTLFLGVHVSDTAITQKLNSKLLMSVKRFLRFALSEQMLVWNRLKSLVRCKRLHMKFIIIIVFKVCWSTNASSIWSLLSVMLPYDLSWSLSSILYLKQIQVYLVHIYIMFCISRRN